LRKIIFPKEIFYNKKTGRIRTTKTNKVFGLITEQEEIKMELLLFFRKSSM